MASTFQSVQVTRGDPPKTPRNGGTITVYGEYEILAALVVDDVIQMVPIPKGARILDVHINTDELDSDGTPEMVLDVGDTDGTDDTDRYIDGTAASPVLARMNNIAGFGYEFLANGTIDIHVETAPETGATSGTLKLVATYELI
jgi:hypothetical protein